MKNQKGLAEKVRDFIENNKRKEALDLLTQAELPHLEDDISALKSQHNKILDDQTLGIIDDDTIRLETNRINKKIFELLNKLERAERSTSEPGRLAITGNSRSRIIALVAGIAVVSLLVFLIFKVLQEETVVSSDPGEKINVDSVAKSDTVPILESINVLELDSLVAYYPFDGGINDFKNSYRTAKSENIKYNFNRYEQSDSALYLNGKSARLEFSKILDPLNNDLSIALWLKTETYDGSIWGQFTKEDFKYIGQNHRFTLADGAFNYDNYPPPDNGRNLLREGYPKNKIEVNVWTHIVLTRHAEKVKLFINGELVATNENAETYVHNDGRGPINHSMIGALVHSNGREELSYGQFFTGCIDDLCIFTTPIDLKTIKDLYEKKYEY